MAKLRRKNPTPTVLIIINGRRQNLAVMKTTEAVITKFTNPAPIIANLRDKMTYNVIVKIGCLV